MHAAVPGGVSCSPEKCLEGLDGEVGVLVGLLGAGGCRVHGAEGRLGLAQGLGSVLLVLFGRRRRALAGGRETRRFKRG